GTGTIVDDDTVPTLSINNITVHAKANATTAATFTVSMTGPSAQDVLVDFHTIDGSAVAVPNNPLDDSDYLARTGTLRIPAGLAQVAVTLRILGDSNAEPAETFYVALTSAVGAVLPGGGVQGTCSIIDDNGPTLTIGNVTTVHGSTGTHAITVPVYLSQPVT